MDLIEQAARRLEELKRTGVDVRDGLAEPGAIEATIDAIVAEHGPDAPAPRAAVRNGAAGSPSTAW
jgi:hypothetical protein